MRWTPVVTGILLFFGASSARAQLLGMPLWNDPNGGTGITISGDAGFPDTDGFGNVYAGRVNGGFGGLQLGATAGVHDPDGADKVSSLGGTVGFRLLGGMGLPIAVNAQGGYSTEDQDLGRSSRYTASVGVGVKSPTPGISLQAWISPGVRMLRRPIGEGDHDSDTRFGIALGGSLGLGLFGLHVGLDHEGSGDSRVTTYGVGIHLGLNAPVGS